MASRKEQKEAARRQREELHAQLRATQQRRNRLLILGGVLVVVIAAAAVFIIASSSSGGGKVKTPSSASDKAQVTSMTKLLAGIPQSGNRLGNPNAPVTVTEYGDLVCPVCDDFALSSEPQLITDEVRTGKVQLLFRGYETASSFANNSEYPDTQLAFRSAGLQNLGWDYIMLMYDEQPQTINGQDAEDVAYITSSYLQGIAQEIPGLKLPAWQRGLTNSTLAEDVTADGKAAQAAGVTGTPTIFFSGPKGTVQYDKGSTEASVIPTLAQMKQLIAQVS